MSIKCDPLKRFSLIKLILFEKADLAASNSIFTKSKEFF